jgi:hypothetical protein
VFLRVTPPAALQGGIKDGNQSLAQFQGSANRAIFPMEPTARQSRLDDVALASGIVGADKPLPVFGVRKCRIEGTHFVEECAPNKQGDG